jgi:rhodanese-related sulfurtransferase
LDVREKGEFVQAQIFRATPIPRGLLELTALERIPTTDVPIVVYCDDGYRSDKAAETLEALGYSDVAVLAGGIAAWKASGGRVDYGTNVPGKDYGEKVEVQRHTPRMTPDELIERTRRGERLIILDSRTREEFERTHVPGAVSVPGGELPAFATRLLAREENRGATLVVNCAGRTRSILGADLLLRMGLEDVYALENGTAAWTLAGHELERGAGATVPAGDMDAAAVWTFAERFASEEGVETISVDDFKRMRERGELHYAIDARLPEEYAAGHLPGSVSMPAGQIALVGDEVIVVNQAPAVFISRSGVRARIAAAVGRQIGYPRCLVLEGGLRAWQDAGGALERDSPPAETPGLDDARAMIGSVTAVDLHAELASGAGVQIVDVRGSGDYALAHLPDSRWIARGELERQIGRYVPVRDRPVVVTDDDGRRAALAARTLNELGYQEVRFLEGGVNAWSAAGFATVAGLDGADVPLKIAKDDVDMIGRRGPLARNRQDMIDYLTWEIGLGYKYAQD